jgi:hypothetical protein
MSLEPYNGKVMDLFKTDNCITIPRYQRKYSWSIVNAHHLIADLMNTVTGDTNHWIGAAITRNLTNTGLCELGQVEYNHTCVELIDGQQRFTTLRLWLLAVEHFAESLGTPMSIKLANLRLQNPNDVQLQKIMKRKLEVASDKNELAQIYTYFRYLLWLGQESLLSADVIQIPKGKLKGQSIEEKWQDWLTKQEAKGLDIRRSAQPDTKLLVNGALNRMSILYLRIENEDPVRIFSALNGNRQELSQFDHLRNYVFAQLTTLLDSQEERDEIFDKYWSKAEQVLELVPTGKGSNADKIKNEFLYDYLISVGEGHYGKFSSENTYAAIVKYLNARVGISNLQKWIKELPSEAELWSTQKYNFDFSGQLHNGVTFNISNKARLILKRIRYASDGPPSAITYFVLRRTFLESSVDRKFDSAMMYSALREIEKTLFKTILAGKSLTTFGGWSIKNLQPINTQSVSSQEKTALDRFVEKLEKYQPLAWASVETLYVTSYCSPESKSLYEANQRACMAVLDAITEELNGGSNISLLPTKNINSGDAPFWIEHIYPQKNDLWSPDLKRWRSSEERMKPFLHDLGNLSVLPDVVNKSISNKTLQKKKDDVQKVKASVSNAQIIPITNNAWLSANEWTEREITARSEQFWKILARRWDN